MDLYDDLDDFSYDDLLKIHTGHQNQPPDDNNSEEGDSDSKSQKSDDDCFPTFFTSEQIKVNLVDAKDIDDKISSTTQNEANIEAKCLEVAKALKFKITEGACFICNKHGSNHYTSAKHCKKVLEWIFQQTGTKDEHVISKIYCKICNTCLDGSENHYTTENHTTNVQFYCVPCKRRFKNPVDKGHIKSKKHKANEQAYTKAQFKSAHTNSRQLPDSKLQITEACDNIAESSVIPVQAVLTPQYLTPTDNLEIATKLQSLLGSTDCHICRVIVEVNPKQKHGHYAAKKHIKNVLRWIQNNASTFAFNLHNPELLYCAACNDVFSNVEIAQAHYKSQKHHENAAMYCTTCLQFFPDMTKHRKTTAHRMKWLAKSTSPLPNQTSTWPRELAQMITLAKCDICSKTLENHHHAYTHYQSKLHEAKVAAWIASREDTESCKHESSSSLLEDLRQDKRESQEDSLQAQVLHEIKIALNKLYFSKSMPPQEALVHLKRINREIAEISKKSPLEKSTDSILLCEPPPKPRTRIDNNLGQFTKFKLIMELKRLKMVLGKVDLVPPELGVQYASNVIEMIRNLASGEQSINEVEINRLFEVAPCELLAWDFEYTKKLRDLDSLESILTSENCKIDLEEGLEVITRFNVQLESSIDDYRNCVGASDSDSSSGPLN